MRVIYLLFLMTLSVSISAQDTYKPLTETDDLIISYQILEVKKKGAMIPEVRLSVQNKSDKVLDVKAILKLNYDWETAEQYEVTDVCVNPGKTKKGKIRGLFFNPENLTMAQLNSEDVEFLIEDLKTSEIQKCK